MNKNMPKVSIIVPVYNVEKYLKRCVDSLLNQTLKDIEIVLVNDASPDNSLKIMKDYEENFSEKIKIIDSLVNLKQGGARNLGLTIATGEFVSFVDSDDWVEKELYEETYDEAIKSNSEIVFFDCLITNDGVKGRYFSMVDGKNMGMTDENKRKALILKPGSCWGKIIKRELLISNNILYPEGIFYEDNCQAHLPMLYVNKCSYLKKPFYNYFQGNLNSTTKLNNEKIFDRCTSAIILMDEVKARGKYELYKEEFDYLFIYYYFTSTIMACICRFKKVEFLKINELNIYMVENFPDFRKNIYYKSKNSLLKKIKIFIIYRIPRLGVIIYRPLTLIKNELKKIGIHRIDDYSRKN